MSTVPRSVRTGPVVAVLAVAGIVVALSQTLVIPLIAKLPEILHATTSNSTWAVTITLLVAAVATPVAGRLGDMYGKKRMLLVSLVPLVVGSVVCALASGLMTMILGRGIQGLAMGMIPLGISLLRDVLPSDRVGTAIALMSSSMGIGGALGLPAAAAVAEFSSWQWLFWGTALIAAVVAFLVWWMIPASGVSGAGHRVDLVGVLGLAAGLVCFLLPVSKGGDWGWGSPVTLGMFVAAAVILVAWGWWELRTREPLVDLRVTARAPVLLTNAASIVVGFGMYAQTLIVPQIMQLPVETGYGLGQSMIEMGLWMAPQGIAMMAVSSLGARISRRYGPKVTLAFGSLILALGYGSAAVLMGSTWGLLIATVVGGAGVGFAYGAMPALIMDNVPLSETGSANGINSLMRSIGTSTSAAVIGVVLAELSTPLGGHVVPTETGFRVALLIGCAAAVVAAGVALTIRQKGSSPVETALPAERELVVEH